MDLNAEEKKLNFYNEIFFEKMKRALGNNWYKLLEEEIKKSYFYNLGKFLHNKRENTIIYPETLNEIFSVFKNLQPDKIKVVIIGQDPYPNGMYDGRAFSNDENTINISPSLRNIFKEIEIDVYNGLKIDQNPCLERWEKQGIFLLNRVLTVEKNKPNSHVNIGWELFTNKVIRVLSTTYSPKIFLLWGNNAKKVKPLISIENNLVLESGHPSPLSANKGYWFENNHFSKTNNFLEEHKIKKINW